MRRALHFAMLFLVLAPVACSHASDEAGASTTDAPEPADSASTSSASAISYDKIAERTRLGVLVAQGNELYDQAEGIVTQTPTTRAQSVRSIELVGNVYYDKERVYKAELLGGPAISLVRDDDLRNADLTLREAEPFLYAAVVESLADCSEHDARLDLKAARAILDATQLILAGRGRDDWTPLDSPVGERRDATCSPSR